MKCHLACLLTILALGACRIRLHDNADQPAAVEANSQEDARSTPDVDVNSLGRGASPGNAKGPGGFVPRGSARNFYAGRGGRLWYYMNNYYWVSDTAPREDLWIRADVCEEFRNLKKWPDGDAVASPPAKVTVEYWEVGDTGRTVRLDNHRDYCLLSDAYSAGEITVEVTLTLGKLSVADKRGRWGPSKKAYVLESRNYATGGGVGIDRARFVALETEAVTVWTYRIPWNTHPQRLTRSSWQDLERPTWKFDERRAPPSALRPAPVVTPSTPPSDES